VTDPFADAATNRRNFLGLLGLGAAAVAGGGLLAGCSDTASTGSQGKAAAVDKLGGLVPNFKQLKVVQADLPPNPPGVDAGFLKYPTSLVRAVTDNPITSGKQVTAMTPLWGPVPPGLGHNAFYDAVNTRLGGQVKLNILDGNTYDQKLSAVLAAGDVPDMVQIPGWNIATLAHFSDAVNKLFADLTPYLQGDKAKDYPLLANLPTDAWKFSVWNNKLHAIPLPNSPYVLLAFYRADLLEKMGVTVQPQNADELYTLAKQINNPKGNRWAFTGGNLHMEMARAFGAPRRWRKKSDGTLEFRYETDEYAAAIEWTAKAFKEGLVHPSVVENKNADTKQLMTSGQALLTVDGPGTWHEQLEQQLGSNPDFRLGAMKPFPAKAGSTTLVWRGEPAGMYVFIKQGLGEDRTKELLRVANWCSAPFGTEEFELRTYGVRDKHFTMGANGPQFTSLGNKEAAGPTYYFLGGHVPEITQSGLPGYVQALWDWESEASKHLEDDPFGAIRVEDPSNFAAIQTPTEDKVNDIIRGKRPLSDLKQVVQEFKSGGGDEGRTFYQKVLEDNS
jgi:putative aldouronate transport system substrate-binding protein